MAEQPAHIVGRNRLAGQVALDAVASHLPQGFQLLLGLHALGYHSEAQAVSQCHDGPQQRHRIRFRFEFQEESLVDLDRVDRQTAEIAQRGVPCAEVVDGNAHTQSTQAAHLTARLLDVVHDYAFGQFQFEGAGVEPGLLQDAGHGIGETGSRELGSRDVYGHLHWRQTRAAPLHHPAACLLQYPAPDGDDKAALLGHGNELRWRDDPQLGMVPDQQRFEAHKVAPDAELRLVAQLEFAVLQGAAQSVLDLQRLQRRGIDFRDEKLKVVLAPILRAVHGAVGVALQGGGVLSVPGINADSDAGGDEQLVCVDLKWRLQRVQQLLRNRQHILLIAQFGQQEGEFVAPHAGQRIGSADAAFQPAGDLLEQRIAHGMAEGVVDLFETVEIHEQHRGQPSLPVCLGQRPLQAVLEEGPVGKAGQRVVLRLEGQLVRQLPLLDRDGGQSGAL